MRLEDRLPRVLVTRAAEDARALSQALGVAGFDPVEVPLIERVWRVEDLADAARERGPFDVVLLTSATAADVFAAAVPHGIEGARYAAVGPATARRLRELGFPTDVVPERATGADLVAALGAVRGASVLYPRADLASAGTADVLRGRGARVVEVVGYANTAPPGYRARLLEALPVEATTALSGSAVERLVEAIPPERRDALGAVVVIGPTTREVADRLGLEVRAQADPHTIGGVVEALLALFPY